MHCRKDVIVFTDGAFDDLVAIMVLISSNRLDSIVIHGGGFSDVGASLRSYSNLLKYLNRDDIKLFVGAERSLFDEENALWGTYQNSVSLNEYLLANLFYNGGKYVPNSTIHKNTRYIERIKDKNLKIGISIGLMTDVLPALPYLDKVYQMGGRIIDIPEDQLEYVPDRVNISASSNIYLDPRAANESLKNYGHKIYWNMSDSVSQLEFTTINDELVRLFEKSCCYKYRNLLTYTARYYMDRSEWEGKLSDVPTALTALYHDEVVEDIKNERIIIKDDIHYDMYPEGNNIIRHFSIARGTGCMYRDDNGSETFIVEKYREKEMKRRFKKLLYIHGKSEDHCYKRDNCHECHDMDDHCTII